MFCKKCGNPIEEGSGICRGCGAQVPVEEKRKQEDNTKRNRNKTRKIIAIIIAIAIVLTSLPAGWLIWSKFNKGDATVIDSDLNYVQIEEQFTDKKISNGAGAINSLNDVADLLGIINANKEFVVKSETVFNGNNYYRLSQVYNEIQVYGRDVVVIADSKGNAKGLTSNFSPVGDVAVKNRLSDEELSTAILSEYEKSSGVKREFVKLEIGNEVIFSLQSSPQRAYTANLVGVSSDGTLIDDEIVIGQDKTILYKKSNISYSKQTQTFQGQSQQQFVSVDFNEEKYSLKDEDRKITVYQAINETEGTKEIWDSDDKDAYRLIEWAEWENPNASAIDAMANIANAYDYFANSNRFGITYTHESDGEVLQSEIDVVVDTQFIKNDGWGFNWTGNAAHDTKGNRHLVIVGKAPEGGVSNSADLGTMAHEYTHGIIDETAGLGILNDSAAINEAYADIFSVFVVGDRTGSTSWKVRYADDPHQGSRAADTYFGYEWKNETPYPNHISEKFTDDSISDDLYAKISRHFNCTIISHTAYLMYNGGKDGEWERINDAGVLEKIWYGSLLSLHSDATFSQCRNSVELSARVMKANGEITEAEYSTVVKAFDSVGIEYAQFQYSATVKNTFDINIINSEGTLNTSCDVEIIQIMRSGKSKNESFALFIKEMFITKNLPKMVLEASVNNGILKDVSLENGVYVIAVSEKDKTPVSTRIVVDNRDKDATENVEILTNFSNIINVIINQEEQTTLMPTEESIGTASGHLATAPSGFTPIYTADELSKIQMHSMAKYILLNDIDLSEWGNWTPLGLDDITGFSGILDGNGYRIINMKVDVSADGKEAYGGLFAKMWGGEIRNIGILGGSIAVKSYSYNMYAGGIAGYCVFNTKISNCFNTATITAQSLGNNGTSMNNSAQVGGIVGEGDADIDNCFNTGKLSAIDAYSNSYVGGLAGVLNNSIVKNYYNVGELSSKAHYGTKSDDVGGLIGYQGSVNEFANCYYLNNVNKAVGYDNISTINNSLSNVEMKTQATYIGFDFSGVWGISPSINNGYPYLKSPNIDFNKPIQTETVTSNIEFTAERLRASIIGKWGAVGADYYHFFEDGSCRPLADNVEKGTFKISDDKTLYLTFPWSSESYEWNPKALSEKEGWYMTDYILIIKGIESGRN